MTPQEHVAQLRVSDKECENLHFAYMQVHEDIPECINLLFFGLL
jgi:hypothetical protein